MDRFNWRQIVIPVAYILLSGVIAIFAHSGLQGEHGLAAYRATGEEERRLLAELSEVRGTRETLENKVRRLSDDYLDLELVDERARAVLGAIRADEVVIR